MRLVGLSKSPIVGRRPLGSPQIPARLREGLVFLMLPDLAGPTNVLANTNAPTNAGSTFVPGIYGPKIVVPATDNTELRYGTDTLKFQSDKMTTIVMAAAPNGWVSQDGLVGWRDAGNTDMLWRFRNDTTTNRMYYQHANSDTTQVSANTLTQAWMFDGRIFCVAGVSNVTTVAIYAAEPFTLANYTTNSNSGSAVKSSETAPLAIGKDRISDSVGGGWDGDIYLVAMWKDRVLTTDEIRAVFRDPYGLARYVVAPRAVTTADQTVTPGIAALFHTGYAPFAGTSQEETPSVGRLTYIAYAPTVSTSAAGQTVTPATARMTISTSATTVILGLLAGAKATTSTTAVGVTADVSTTPAVVRLTFTGYAPTITTPVVAQSTPGAGSETLVGYTPEITAIGTITVTPGVARLFFRGWRPIVTGTRLRATGWGKPFGTRGTKKLVTGHTVDEHDVGPGKETK